MKAGRRHRMLGTFAVVLAIAGAGAPAASADQWYLDTGSQIVSPDDRGEARGPGAAPLDTAVRPDDRAARPSLVTAPALPEGLPDDRAGVRGPGAAPAPAHIVVSVDGFDWTDAAIGAALSLGLILLGTGGLLVARRHRKPSVAAY